MPATAASASTGFSGPRELLAGIDTLDLTCKTPAPKTLLSDLAAMKAEAGERPREAVTVNVGEAVLRVMPGGMGQWWPFRLDHRLGQLGVGESANRPAWRVSPSAEALHLEGPAAVVAFWQAIIEGLTGGPALLMASRLDVHADFADLSIGEADRDAFVCKSERQSVEASGGTLQTLYFGKGGDVTVRVYDKLAEVQASGKGGYLLDLYDEAGLQDGQVVQRVEAQLRRDPLRTLGVLTAEDAINRCGPVYLYAVQKWLRLIVPGSATRRERAKLDPRWTAVQAASIGQGVTVAERREPARHTPALDALVPMVAGCTISAGDALGIHNFDALWSQLGVRVRGYLEDQGRNFAAEVQARRLEFGISVA